MKIEILKSTMCGGKPAKVGAKIEASDSDARYLINTGKAKKAEPKKAAKADRAVDPKTLENRGE